MNPALVFPALGMLLGGIAKSLMKINREITGIEPSVPDELFRITLNGLRSAWHTVTPTEFPISSHETEPQLLRILAPDEAVVAVSREVKIGDNAGMMNIGIP
jgi:flagellar motor switch protein FliM